MVLGDEKKLVDSFKQSGWSIVDKTKQDAMLAMGLAVLTKASYVTMPMSELMLFGRSQDYGFAMGDPLKVSCHAPPLPAVESAVHRGWRHRDRRRGHA